MHLNILLVRGRDSKVVFAIISEYYIIKFLIKFYISAGTCAMFSSERRLTVWIGVHSKTEAFKMAAFWRGCAEYNFESLLALGSGPAGDS